MVKIILLVIGGCVFVLLAAMVVVPKVTGTAGNITEVGETYSYTVEGEVSKPGTYTLSDAVTMLDLITAAGGTVYNTDELSYFDDAKLTVGNTYYIGGRFDASDLCSNEPIKKVNVNKATAQELAEINGITSTIASSIVSYRVGTGTFNTIEDIMNVYGIGNATYRKIRNYVTLHE